MKKLRQVGAVLVLLGALAGPAAAQASGAHLDRDFGSGGIRFLPEALGEATGVALVGDGRVVVGGEEEIVALLPSGRFDAGFGRGGRARLAGPASGVAEASAIAVDPAGRPVAVGGFRTGTGPGGAVWKVETFVQRFTSAGRPDRGFGGGDGYVLGGLGLPPPSNGEPPEGFVGEVAFDSSDRIVLKGESNAAPAAGKGGGAREGGSFLARLSASGRVDRSFAASGLYWLPGPGPVDGSLAVGPGGRVVAAATHDGPISILQLRASGRPDNRFGKSGFASYPPGAAWGPLLVDRRGRTITFGYLEGVEGRLPNGILIRRLRPNGALDRSFGRSGAARLRIRRFYVAELALDRKGRILMAASLKARGEVGEPKELALVRLRPDGRLDRSFGREGMIRIPFPGKYPHPSVYLEGFDVRGDQAAIGAVYCGAGACRSTVTLVDLGERRRSGPAR